MSQILCFLQGFPEMVKEPARFSSGPWGGNGGRRWDDGVFSGVKKIFLFNGEAIYSIQVEYDQNGQSVPCSRHGGGSEGRSYTVIGTASLYKTNFKFVQL